MTVMYKLNTPPNGTIIRYPGEECYELHNTNYSDLFFICAGRDIVYPLLGNDIDLPKTQTTISKNIYHISQWI